MTLRTDKSGRILLPKLVRKHLGIEPGDEVQLLPNADDHSFQLSAAPSDQDQILVMTEWGFPIVYTKQTLPADFDTVVFTKETYEEHFRKKLGF
ncbi:AbrB/MazE/SpoVT family DNA-binding domain-containing protein [Neolewinella lacunae]|uniref:AbrB/MazE/SpoVT family DNA-binding domain-containing protein n=1 Tax=Neolewinella lacunae TaxID=1517758 RepID=A0A923PLX7_9BACT|nr:AbrB/MazE/SpoVT family DNA-binding domain-containing protein [Neolewinella lacunae]MBC6993709.1 AbrB/MazE/SpoVT family DNA-binding domain-containing protein [Neolewinella lacunae]MDN3636129.1 AbrB/MazE/SpoVT family DNA-binding domain-containing protein [Neolewinella lacunae]